MMEKGYNNELDSLWWRNGLDIYKEDVWKVRGHCLCGCEVTEYNAETTVHVVDNDDETCPGASLTI